MTVDSELLLFSALKLVQKTRNYLSKILLVFLWYLDIGYDREVQKLMKNKTKEFIKSYLLGLVLALLLVYFI